MTEWLWGHGGGHTLFDPYSLQHVVWFFAITIALAALRFRHLWIWVLGLAVLWEVAEWWIVDNIQSFPFVGREDILNKAVGDPISDFAGFLLGVAAMRAVHQIMSRKPDSFAMLLEKAKSVAEMAHRGQDYGEYPYAQHLFETWDVLGKFGFTGREHNKLRRKRSQRLILAAILHDTLEDTDLTHAELEADFGSEVADLVFAVTNEPGADRRERFLKTFPKILAHPDATILKLADRIANVIHALQSNWDILRMYCLEWSEFERMLRIPGECDAMWGHLESLLRE
jgi:hypothetical protein